MRIDAMGTTIHEATLRVEPIKVDEMTAAIGTDSGSQTATLVPWFGVTVGGERLLVEALEMDLGRALLAGHSYKWARPFVTGEVISAVIFVEKIFSKGDNEFAVLVTEFRDASGELVQSQTTTFIERGAA